jgi:hypothetical protein
MVVDVIINGEWRMENGEWRMHNAECRMDNAECRMDNAELFALTTHFLLYFLLPTSCFLLRIFDIPSKIPYSARIFHRQGCFLHDDGNCHQEAS